MTIIEKGESQEPIFGFLKMDGFGYDALMIPAGGARTPSSQETALMHEDAAGNFRAFDHLVMKGDDVFNFVQREVPPMIESLLEKAGCSKNAVDYYMFHQPNKFMLGKLADKLGVPREKMPANIVENYGNASGVSIPTVVTHNLGDRLTRESLMICFAGFGVGLTWAALLMRLENLKFNEIINF